MGTETFHASDNTYFAFPEELRVGPPVSGSGLDQAVFIEPPTGSGAYVPGQIFDNLRAQFLATGTLPDLQVVQDHAEQDGGGATSPQLDRSAVREFVAHLVREKAIELLRAATPDQLLASPLVRLVGDLKT